jgi:hypothetical protein
MSEPEKNPYIRRRAEIFSRLSNYRGDYTVEQFMSDFLIYFDDPSDFNLQKIREYVESQGKLPALIDKARKNNTHPVAEFVRDLFRELGGSGDIEWSGQL